MNKIFKIIWNSTLGRLTIASEAAHSRGKSSGQRLQAAPAVAVKASPVGILRPLVVAIGLVGSGVSATATAEDATFDNLTVNDDAILSALEVSGAATITGSLTVGGEDVATVSDIAGIGTNASAITGLDGRVDTNETDIAGLDGRVTTNESDIAGLDADLGNLDTRVGANESAITGLDGRVATNETDIAGLDGRVTTNETDIAGLDADLGNLDTRVGANESAITGLDGRVATNETDIADLDGRVTTNETDIAGLDADLGNLDTRVGDNETDINTINDSLTDLGVDENSPGVKYFRVNSDDIDAQANGSESVAIGPSSVAGGTNSLAAGLGATTSDVADNGIALGNQARAEAGNSLAVGNQANAALESGTAIGNQAQAKAENSIALGKQTLALGDNATSIGATGDPITTLDLANDGADLTSINGVPVTATGTPLDTDGTYNPTGPNEITEIAGVAVDEDGVNQFINALKSGANLASGTNSVSLGVGTIAAGDSSVAIGDRASAASDAVGIGRNATATGSAVSIGPGATASGANSFAGGNNATASGANSFAAGAGAQAGGVDSIALGRAAVASATNNISIGEEAGVGTNAVSAGDQVNNIAIGAQAGQNVAGQRNVAMGSSAGNAADGNDNIAFGSGAGNSLEGDSNISIGLNANNADGGGKNRAVGIGEDASAGTDGVAIGHEAVASGANGLALGSGAATSGAGVALGENADAATGYVALGSGTQALQSDVNGSSYLTNRAFSGSAVSVGNSETGLTRRIVNVEDGAQDTDAVNVRQLQYAVNNIDLTDPDFADGVILDLQDQIDQNLLSYVSIEDGGTDRNNKDNSGALGVRSLAIGPDASTSNGADDATAIGSSVSAEGASSVVLGHDVQALNDNAVVIGSQQTEARDESGVAIGADSQSRGTNSIVIGTRSESDDQDGTNVQNSIVIGTDSQSTAREGIVIGRNSLVNAERAMAQGDNAEATADDAMAVGTGSRASGVSAQASGTRASASGANALASGTDANASGADAQASGTDASASGTNAQASGTDASASGVSAQASGTRASASGANAIASGTDARGYASDGIAMGTGAQAGFEDPNNLDPLRNTGGIAIGNQARADEEHALALGVEAQARAQSATAIGDGAEASDTAQGGLAVGAGAGVTALNAAAFGQSAEAEATEALAMGSGARADAQSATAIGDGALANHQGSVALGSNAVTAAPVPTDEMTVDNNTYDFAGTSPVATVSVGGLGEERTLTNVAAGRVSATSTDAVNGSQLYGTNQAVDALADNLDTAGGSVADVMGGNAAYDPQTHQVTMNNVGGTGEDTVDDAIEYAAQGWDVTANNDAGANVAPGGSVDFSSTDSNIAISRTGTDLVFNLAEDIGVNGSVSVGSDTVIDGDSVTTNNLTVGGDTFVVAGDTVTYDGNEIATQADGLSFAGNTGGAIDKTLGDTTPLTVSGGLASGEASSGANLRVDSDGNQLNLVMARNLTELDSVTTGNSVLDTGGLTVNDGTNSTEYGAAGMTITGGPSVTSGGIDAGDQVIANVADGDVNAISSDAINGSQLQAAGDSLASNVLGGNADYTGNDFTMSDVGGTGEDTIDEAIASANTAANAGWDISAQGSNPTNVGPGDSVDLNNSDGNIEVSKTTTDNDVTFDLADDIDVASVTADDGAGNVTAVTATGTSVTDGTDSTAYGADGMTITGGPSVTTGGIDAGDQVIANVADGDVNATSGDAINGSQLQAAGDSLASNVLGGNADYTGNDFTMSDVGGTGEDTIDEAIASANTAANAGWNVADANGNSHNIGPNGQVTFEGDSNVTVTESGVDDDAKVQVALNDDITVDSVAADSVTTGNSTLDTDGLTVDDGAGNVTEVAATGTSVTDGTDSTAYGADGMTITGGPSVTSGGIDAAGNTITGVADGAINSTSSDAINGSQLQAAGDSLASNVLGGNADYTGNDFTMSDVGGTGEDTIDEAIASANTAANAGWNVTDANGNSHNIGPNGEVAFTGDGNIGVAQTGIDDEGEVEITLNRDLDLDSVTTGDTAMDDSGVQVGDATGNDPNTTVGAGEITVAGSGTDPNTISINGDAGDVTGLANTDLDGADFAQAGRAATEEQLDLVNQTASAGWNLSGSGADQVNIGPNGNVDFQGDGNISVAQSGVEDGGQIDITLNRDLDVDSVTTGNTLVNDDGLTVDDGAGNLTTVTNDGLTIAGGPSVTSGGIDAAGNTITGVADGAINSTSSDAINGSQLQAAGDSLASNVLGGNADYTGNDFTMSDVGGTGEDTIDEAIASANTAANAGWDISAQGSNPTNVGPGDSVDLNNSDGNIEVSKTTTDNDVTFDLADDIDVASVTADDGAGNVTAVTATGTSVTDGTDSTAYGADGMTITGGPSVTSGGIDAGDQVIANVADGDVNATSGDAINGSQLQAAGDSLASNVLGGNADYAGNDFTMSDVGGTGEDTIDEAIASANTAANAGWNVADANGNSHNIGPNGQVTFEGDSNVTVTESGVDDDAKVQVALNDDITVDSVAADSVTTGNSTLDTDGLTVDDGAGNVTEVAATGTSVTDGTDSTAYGADGMTITGGPSVTSGGIDAGDQVIANVADGDVNATSSDAINGSQLQAAGDSLASNVLGGNADYTGNDFTMSDVGGTGEDTIDEAIASANTAANAGWDISAQGSNPTNVGPGDSVDLNNSDGNIEVSKTTTDNDVTFDLADDIDVASVTADDGAGNVTAVTATGTSVTDGTDSTAYGADGMTITGGPSVTSGGIDAGDQVIANVADGDVNATSGDAINGSQLQAAGDSLASNVLGGNADYTGNDFTMSDVGGTGEDTIDEAIASANTAANAGWNVADANGNSHNIGPNGQVTFEGDSNVTVTESGVDDDAKVQVALNDDITVDSVAADSVTTGNSTLDTDGLTVDDGAGNVTEVAATGTSVTDGTDSTAYGADGMTITGGPSVTSGGIDAGDQVIANVADGVADSDAVNVSQLSGLADTPLTFAGDSGSNVERKLGETLNLVGGETDETALVDGNIGVVADGSDTLSIQLAENVNLGETGSVTTGNTLVNDDGLTVDDGAGNLTTVTNDGLAIAGGPSVTSGGIDAAGNTITGVADGAINSTSSDAINGSQLQAAGDSLASNVLGGNADYTGNDFTMSDVGGTGEDTIDEAIASANTAANAGWNVTDADNNAANIGPNGEVAFTGDGNIGVAQTGIDDEGEVEITLNRDLDLDSVTTGDTAMDDSGVQVGDATGNDPNTTVGAGEITVAGSGTDPNTISINGDAGDVTGLANTDLDGADFAQAGRAATEEQLDLVNQTASAGWNLSGSGANQVNIGPNGNVDFQGDGNISVAQSGVEDDGQIDITLNPALNVDSVTTGNSVLDTDGLAVTDTNGNQTTTGATGTTVMDAAGNMTTVSATGTSVTDGTDSTAYGADGMTITGGPSVTSGGIDAGDQVIANVADGVADSDAVNVSQLSGLADTPLTFAGDSGSNVERKLGETLNLVGGETDETALVDGNIGVVADGSDTLSIQLAENVNLGETGSVTTGDTMMNNAGVNVDDTAGNTTEVSAGSINVTSGGNSITMDGGAGDITGLANTDLDGADFAQAGRAATEEQLDLVNQTASAGWNLSGSGANQVNIGPNGKVDFQGDGNISVAQNGAEDDGEIDITLNPDLNVDSVTAGDATLDTEGLVVNDSTANPTATTSVEAGMITLAANPTTGSANEIVIDANSGTVGGLTNATFDPDNFTSGQAATEDQLGQVYTVANAGWSVSVDGEGAQSDGSNNVGPGEVVDFTSEDGNVVINRDGTNLAFNLADSITLGDGETAINVDGEKGEIGVGDTLVNGGGVSVGDDVSLGDTGLEIAGGPSVTAGGIDAGGSKITGVAAGDVSETSTDAINGSQLYDVQQIANAGWNLTGSGANEVNIGPEGSVDFQGDSNISVVQAGTDNAGEIQVALNDTITLGEGDSAITLDGTEGSIATGDTIMNGDGVRVGDDVALDETGLAITGGPSVTVSGINAGGMQITNVGSGLGGQSLDQISGDDLMNAVNVGDLQQVAGDIGDDVAAAKTEVTEGKNISVTESTGSDGQTIYEVATADEVEFDKMDVGSVTIDKDNVDGDGNTIIAGVGRGEVSADSTDAVNGGQLYDVKEEIGDINNSLDGGMDFAADEGDAVNRKLGDTVAITGDNNITTRTSDDGVQVTLNQELNVDSVSAGRTTVSDQGVTIEGGPSMTVDGIDGGGKRVTNVAPGVEATDAVNVGQMQELNQRFAQEINNVHGRINEVEKNANAGSASAIAASTVPQAWMPGKSMVGVGTGTYEGETAISVGVSRLSDNGRFVIQGKVTGDSQSNFGAGIGAGWHW